MRMKKYLKKLLNSFFWILDKINKNAFVKNILNIYGGWG